MATSLVLLLAFMFPHQVMWNLIHQSERRSDSGEGGRVTDHLQRVLFKCTTEQFNVHCLLKHLTQRLEKVTWAH